MSSVTSVGLGFSKILRFFVFIDVDFVGCLFKLSRTPLRGGWPMVPASALLRQFVTGSQHTRQVKAQFFACHFDTTVSNRDAMRNSPVRFDTKLSRLMLLGLKPRQSINAGRQRLNIPVAHFCFANRLLQNKFYSVPFVPGRACVYRVGYVAKTLLFFMKNRLMLFFVEASCVV